VFVSYALYGVLYEENNQQNNLRDYKRKSLDWSELFIQTKKTRTQEIANVLSPTASLPSKLYEIEEKGKELSNVYSYGPGSHVWHNGSNSCSMQYSMQ
jgi:hypothetical protein